MSRCKWYLAVLALLSAAGLQAAETNTWRRTETTLTLLRDGRVVWQVVADPAQGKPYFHPLATPGGVVLTGLRPADHPWHRGLWWSWKYINGLNYWEEDRKTGRSEAATELLKWTGDTRPDGSARLTFALSYHPWQGSPVLTEERTVNLSAPSESGYVLDWTSAFTAVTNVILERTPPPGQPNSRPWGGYAGFSLRLAAGQRTWTFRDSEGRLGQKDLHGQPARWVKLTSGAGGPAAVIFDDPSNFQFPSRWFVDQNMPYFSPAVIFEKPRELRAGEKLTLRYRLQVTDHDPGDTATEGAKP
jgi:hypothetical protein